MKLASKNLSLYAMVAFYFFGGIGHFIFPDFYLLLMPGWLPEKELLIIISGIVEILLAVALIPVKTRKASAWLIIAMLITYFFINHVNMAVDYYQTDNKWLWASIFRVVMQIPLIWWAYSFTKEER